MTSPLHTVQEFECLRAKLSNSTPELSSEQAVVLQRFLLNAMRDSHPWYHVYRANQKKYDLEKDLVKGLNAFLHPSNPIPIHHAKHVRRFLLRRYAGFAAIRVSLRIYAQDRGLATLLWLAKDLVLPRAALALLLGYGLVLGARDSSLAFTHLTSHHPVAVPVLGFALSWLLIWFNARNQAGRRSWLWLRALLTTAGLATWAALFSVAASGAFSLIGWSLDPYAALGVSSAATPLCILGQFFFGSDRSLVDPL